MATSGNYRKFVEVEGKKLGHTINPKTFEPSYTDLLSVTVLAPSCEIADALATAFMVWGYDRTKAWVTGNSMVDVMLVRDGGNGEYEVFESTGFPSSKN